MHKSATKCNETLSKWCKNKLGASKIMDTSETYHLLFKLDIQMAFDSMRWDYLLDLLQKRGFPSQFCNWITAIFATSTSRVLLNGIVGSPFAHGHGSRQGDPLSPLLFYIAIDPPQQILDIATTHGLLHKIKGRFSILRTSLYANDVAVFVAPIKENIQSLSSILISFGKVTSLHTNFQNSSAVPIRCDQINLDEVLEALPAERATFPLWYLGLPLSIWRL
jgi:hypothetical protein